MVNGAGWANLGGDNSGKNFNCIAIKVMPDIQEPKIIGQ